MSGRLGCAGGGGKKNAGNVSGTLQLSLQTGGAGYNLGTRWRCSYKKTVFIHFTHTGTRRDTIICFSFGILKLRACSCRHVTLSLVGGPLITRAEQNTRTAGCRQNAIKSSHATRSQHTPRRHRSPRKDFGVYAFAWQDSRRNSHPRHSGRGATPRPPFYTRTRRPHAIALRTQVTRCSSTPLDSPIPTHRTRNALSHGPSRECPRLTCARARRTPAPTEG